MTFLRRHPIVEFFGILVVAALLMLALDRWVPRPVPCDRPDTPTCTAVPRRGGIP